jgi:autotransporter-associated beta strand protein
MTSSLIHCGLAWLGRLASNYLVLLCCMAAFARADLTVLDAGSSATFTGAAGASTTTWLMNGQTISTDPGFTWSPTVNQFGTHWLQCEQAFPDGTKSTREWGLRVRLPEAVGGLRLYVSPTGADTNPGSIGAPFLTLEKARDTIRSLPRPLPAGGVTVYLRGGIHRRTNAFTLAPEDSGDSLTAPIVYAGYPGETAILSNGRALNSGDFSPLAASEHSRVAPGIDPARIWEVDLSTFTRTSVYPAAFNAWRSYDNSGYGSNLLDVYFNNSRAWMSRYPNTSDDEKTTHNQTLEMNGVVLSPDGVTYLNRQGTYIDSGSNPVAVGGAFYYDAADAARIERWQSALTEGGAWIQGHWNNSWTINTLKVQLIDPGNKVIAIDSSINSSKFQTGLGNKYTRDGGGLGNGPGSYNEPWWVLNLLEEMDVTGEWCVDFSRNKLYFLAPDTNPPADGAVVVADTITPLANLTGSHVRLQNLTFQESLGNALTLAGSNNLVVGCTFRNISRNAVEINGSMNGVVSCNLTELGGAGVMVLGGSASPRAPSGNFVVNNDITKFGRIGRVYFGGIHAGYKTTAVGARVAHNRVANTPHGGIFHGSFDSVFEYNDVSDFCLYSDDMGGFYSFPGVGESAGHVFRYNYIHDSGRSPNNSLLGNSFYFDLAHEEMTLFGNISHQTVRHSWYKHGNQIDSGVPQLVYNFNNLSIEDGAGFEYVAPKPTAALPSKIEYNATVGSGTPFRSQEVLVSNGVATGLGAWSASAAPLESTTGSHRSYAADIGFADMAADDFRLSPASPIYQDLPGFKPIPFELIGLYNDEFRSGIPVRKPFVVNGTATVSGASAVVSGTLAFPQFESGTTVKLYWGTADGGTNPTAWENATDLGARAAGPLAVTLAGLNAGVTYYFRFFAENSAGSHWATSTGNTAAGGPAAVLPAGALLHLDASNAGTVVKDGSNKINRWNDAAGGTSYATQVTAANQPTMVSDSALGKTVVDFGAFTSNSSGQWMQLKSSSGTDLNLTTIRSVIAVMKGANFLLGDNDKYHFHRASNDATSPLWSSQYASGNLRSGQAWLNGGETPINSTNDNLPADYWLLSVTTDGNPVEASRLACDRTNRTGGQTICEILIYDRVLTSAERAAGETYLRQKWLGYTGGGVVNKPQITTPGNIAVEATGATGAVVNFTTTAIDAEDGPLATTQSPPSGTTFALGGHTVSATATDSAGNISRETFAVTVQDTAPPQITGPSELHIEATGPAGAVVDFTTFASDVVSGACSTINVPPSGSSFPWGTTSVTTYASDSAGNLGSRAFTITVADTTPPVLGVLPDLTVEATGPDGAAVNFAPSATDLLDPSPLVATTPLSGSLFPLGTTVVNVTATDAAGNSSQGNFSVTVRDTTPPVISVPAIVTVETTYSNGKAVTFGTSASDLVSGTRPTIDVPASGTVFPLGETTVTTTAVDAAGNSASTSFVVRVLYPLPAAPANLTATPASGEVSLNWQAVPFANTYRIKRSLSAGGPYVTIASIPGVSFLDSGRANGLTYYYVVSAVNDTGEGPASAEAVAVMPGGTYQKANNTTVLSTGGSWTGGSVPTAADTALWNGTYDSANASVSAGGGISANRIQITSPSRAMTVTPGTGALTLFGVDGPGIDMSSATQNFTIQAPVILAGNQQWVVNSGRTLTVSGGVGQTASGMSLTKAGAGTLVLSGNQSFSGGLTVEAGVVALAGGSSTGAVTVQGTLNLTGSTAMVAGPISGSAGTIDYKNTLAGGNAFTIAPGTHSYAKIANTSANGRLTLNASGCNVSVSAFGYNTNTGWITTLNGGNWTAGSLGVNSTGAQNGGTVNITGGAVFGATGARYGAHGTWNVGGGGGAGTLNFPSSLSGENGGGGFTVNALSGGEVTFQGLNLYQNSVLVSNNSLNVGTGGRATVTGNLTLGNTTSGKSENNSVNLSDGTLRVSGTIQAGTATAGQTRVFNWTGGQLTVGTITASANFNAPSSGGISTTALEQTAGTLAPGDIGTAGRTAITGGYNLGASGTLAIDIGGSTQATAYQTGQYDYLTVSTTTTLAGTLSVKLINGFTPTSGQSFTILNSTGALSGAFANAAFGARILTAGGEGTFLVTQSGNTVVLSGFVALTPQEGWRHQYFGTSENAGPAADTFDADSDGMANLLEYALGTIPTSSASSARPVMATAANHLTLAFNRIADPVLIYLVEASPDLSAASWSPIWQSTGAQNIAGPVTVTDSTHDITNSTPPRRFLRLRVLAP